VWEEGCHTKNCQCVQSFSNRLSPVQLLSSERCVTTESFSLYLQLPLSFQTWSNQSRIMTPNFRLCSPCTLTLTFNFFNQQMHLFTSVHSVTTTQQHNNNSRIQTSTSIQDQLPAILTILTNFFNNILIILTFTTLFYIHNL
jgi:hypothetical protein